MYEQLKQVIHQIQLIDDHGHPGFAQYFESLPKEQRIPFAVDLFKTPEESSAGFPYLRELHYEAYEKIYGFSRQDLQNPAKEAEIREIYEKKRQNLNQWFTELLDLSGVELLLANIAWPKGLENHPRLRFVPSVDCLVFPFDNSLWKKRTLSRYFIGYFEYALQEIKKKHGYVEQGFDGYINFVDQVLQSYYEQKNVAAFKFVIAYARNTLFEKINPTEAPVLYKKAHGGDPEAYRKLQDFLVWYILRKIVAYDMAVQFHFAITDNYVNYFDPLNLSNLLEDEELKDAKIVILHGAYPRYNNAEILALGGLTPNRVCIDISGRIMFANHPRVIAKMLRNWLEKPLLWDKLLYGSDVLWGERYVYTCAKTGRQAVYDALAGMIDEGILDETTAIAIAKKILRENALSLYRL